MDKKVTISIHDAREMCKAGGSLKDLALSVFTEEEIMASKFQWNDAIKAATCERLAEKYPLGTVIVDKESNRPRLKMIAGKPYAREVRKSEYSEFSDGREDCFFYAQVVDVYETPYFYNGAVLEKTYGAIGFHALLRGGVDINDGPEIYSIGKYYPLVKKVLKAEVKNDKESIVRDEKSIRDYESILRTKRLEIETYEELLSSEDSYKEYIDREFEKAKAFIKSKEFSNMQ